MRCEWIVSRRKCKLGRGEGSERRRVPVSGVACARVVTNVIMKRREPRKERKGVREGEEVGLARRVGDAAREDERQYEVEKTRTATGTHRRILLE